MTRIVAQHDIFLGNVYAPPFAGILSCWWRLQKIATHVIVRLFSDVATTTVGLEIGRDEITGLEQVKEAFSRIGGVRK